jgi:phage terminase Nu1 subunit (DNA packaging protein)
MTGGIKPHATDAELAAALGVTPRTLTSWRRAGAPLSESGGDELLVRLWHAAQAPRRRGKARGRGELAAPGPALAPYFEQLAPLLEAAAPRAEAADRLKEQLARKAELHNAKAERLLVEQAQRAFGGYAASLRDQLTRALLGDRLSDLWEAAQGPRAQAEPRLLALLRAQLDAAEAATLRAVSGAA